MAKAKKDGKPKRNSSNMRKRNIRLRKNIELISKIESEMTK